MSHEEKLRTGWPAFAASSDGSLQPGMTLRDYFAGQALQGWLAMASSDQLDVPKPEFLAAKSYTIADAMLAARKAGGE